MNILKKVLFAVSVAAVLLFSGCSNQIQNDTGLAYIQGISIGKVNARTAFPEPEADLSNFVLSGSCNGGVSKTLGEWATKEALDTAKIAVSEGDWSFKLTAKCGSASLSGNCEKTIVTGVNTLDFTLVYTSYGSGTGAFEVSIKVPETVKAVKAGLYSTSDYVVTGYNDEFLTIDENHIACYKKTSVSVSYNRIVKFFLYGDEEATLFLNTVEDVIVFASDSISKDFIEIESVNDVYEITLENLKETDTLNGNFKKIYTRRNDVTLPVPQRANHTFLGWFEGDTKVESWKAGERLSDITLTAKWQYDSKVSPKGMPSTDSIKLTWIVPEDDDFFKETVITFGNEEIVIGKDEPSEYEVTELTPETDYTFYFTAVSVDGLEGRKIRVISTPGSGLVSIADLADYLEANKAMEVIPVRITDSEITNEKADLLNGLFKNNSIKVALDLSLVDSIKISGSYYCEDWVSIVTLKLGGHIETDSYTFDDMDNLKSLEIADNTYIQSSSRMFSSSNLLESLVIGDNCYIDSSWMFDRSGLKSVEAGKNVEFEYGTFSEAEKLESAIFGEGCKFGSSTFNDCKALKELILPEGLTEIPSYFFQKTSFVSYTVPETVTKIGQYAFADCENLETIVLPESVDFIDAYAFRNCSKLKSIDLSNVKSIGSYAFSKTMIEEADFSSLTSISFGSFQNCVTLKKVVIGDNLKSVYYHSFDGCTNLSTVELGENVTTFEDNAFKNCTSLEYIFIPKNVSKISGSAFAECENITFEVSEDNGYFSTSDDGKMIMNKAQTTLVLFPGAQGDISETFPDTLVLGTGAFKGNTKITKAKIPGGMISVPEQCFSGCTALEEVDLNNATEIGSSAFSTCTSLTSIDLSKVKKIGSSAFFMSQNHDGQPDTGKLGDIDLSSIEYLGNYAFQDAGLKNVILPDNFNYSYSMKYRLYRTFARNSQLRFVLSENAENFTTAEDGKILLSKDKKVLVDYPSASGDVTLPDCIETIGAYAFAYSNITGITIPSNVRNIEYEAFSYSWNFTRFDIEEGLERIEDYGLYFTGGKNLVITIPSSVTYIGDHGLYLEYGTVALTETEGWTVKNSKGESLDLTKYDLTKPGDLYWIFTDSTRSTYIWTREPAGATE